VLIKCSDAAISEFLIHLNSTRPPSFIMFQLDALTFLVETSRVDFVEAEIRSFINNLYKIK
jgi:hypothetical protein